MILTVMPGNANQSNNALNQSFEKIDQATGGVAGQVVDSVKTAASETVQQIAQTPLDILDSLIGGGSSDSGVETSTSGSDPMAHMQAGGDGNAAPNNPEFTKKLDEERQKREALIRQHRAVLQQYEDAFKQKKAEEERMKEMQENQEEQEKEQQEFYKKKAKQDPRWMQALKNQIGPGKGETGKSVN